MQTSLSTGTTPQLQADGRTTPNGLLSSSLAIKQILDAISDYLIVLDEQRRVVFVNKMFLSLFQTPGETEDKCKARFFGKRLGEVLHCSHLRAEDGKCGTSASCQICGAVMAVQNSQKGNYSPEEFNLSRNLPHGGVESLIFRISAQPMPTSERKLTLVTLTDISNEKRRYALERIFFHDLMNTATGLQGLVNMLLDLNVSQDVQNISGLIFFTSEQLIEDIKSQKILNAAERNDLKPEPSREDILPLLQQLAITYSAHDVARHRFIRVADGAQSIWSETDFALLRRVVLNLLKNALEATAKGNTVTLNLTQSGGNAVITVHNAEVMPETVKLQVFNRSFSTRGAGRGLGTYSVRLLTEGYLGGKASFTSTAESGTTFTVTIPLKWNCDKKE